MAEYFTMYPTMSDDMKAHLGFEADAWEFSYNDGEEFPVSTENKKEYPGGYAAQLKDLRGVWSAESYNLNIACEIRYSDCTVLFGPEGIAPADAELGLALTWISTGSDCRGVVCMGTFDRDKKSGKISFSHNFIENKLKVSIVLDIIVYLKKSGNAVSGEHHLAKREGTVLGTLRHCEIFIDGNGSFFPIAEVNEPDKPLWWVQYNETADPFEDKFTEDNVAIYLNAAHPNYKSMKIGATLRESSLFLEVISSALFVIVESVKESAGKLWEQIIKGESYETGSIAQAINYFVNKLEWDVSSPVKLAASIRQFFDRNLQEVVS